MIDTSPRALAELKARPATAHRLFDGDFVVALIDALEEARGTPFEWRRVNDEPFEYAIRQGRRGDEFITTIDGVCLRRAALEGKPAP